MKKTQTTLRLLLFVTLFACHSAFANYFRWTRQPQNIQLTQGDDVTFSLDFNTDLPYTLNWRINYDYVEGATNKTLTVTNVQPAGFEVDCVVGFPTGSLFPDSDIQVSWGASCNVAIDTNPPVVSVTYPLVNQQFTNDAPQSTSSFGSKSHIHSVTKTIPVKGTARDNKHLARVSYSLDGINWQDAIGTTNWYDNLNLVPGTNNIFVKAYDRAGNVSVPTKRQVFFVVTNQLDVVTTGQGTTTLTNDQWLTLERAYTTKAIAAPGYVFKDWSGTVSSTNASLTFIFHTNTVLQANFVTNQCLPGGGVYNGLFYESTGVTFAHAGLANITVKTNGIYSGRLMIEGDIFSLGGTISPLGFAHTTISRFKQGKSMLAVDFNIDITGHPDQIIGTIGDGTWSADLVADRSVPQSTFNGSYTMLLPGGDGITAPEGFGYATMKVANNTLAFSGTLPDNTKPGQSVPVSKNGNIPLFSTLYPYRYVATNPTNSLLHYTNSGTAGLLVGWLQITNNRVSGTVDWIRTSGTNLFPNGFTNECDAIGSLYVAPTTKKQVVSQTNLTITLSGTGLPTPITKSATLTTNNVFVVALPNANSLKASITPASGLMSGSFIVPGDGLKTTTFAGIILQQQNIAAGFFTSTNHHGVLRVNP